MAVKIRLKRMGKMRAPYYRVVVMDSRSKRDGRAIEEIGKYHPTEDPSYIEINSERALYWLGVGAQPTEQVAALLKVTGDWQKHKGLYGQEGTLKGRSAKDSAEEAIKAAEAEAELKKAKASEAKEAEKKASEEAAAAEAAAAEAPAEEAAPDAEAPAEEAAAEETPAEDAPEATEEA
ncbi:MAG: 30S ribosomal protein S16 [bacterium]|nr:30S ribosomal protein S16 [bacterium]